MKMQRWMVKIDGDEEGQILEQEIKVGEADHALDALKQMVLTQMNARGWNVEFFCATYLGGEQ